MGSPENPTVIFMAEVVAAVVAVVVAAVVAWVVAWLVAVTVVVVVVVAAVVVVAVAVWVAVAVLVTLAAPPGATSITDNRITKITVVTAQAGIAPDFNRIVTGHICSSI